MAGVATIKLQTNIPITGTINYCDYAPTKNPEYSDQIVLKGKWDGAGEGRIYLNVALEQELQNLGIIGNRADNGNYKLLIKNPNVKILRTEDGNKKRTTIELLGAPAVTSPATTPTQATQPRQPQGAASYSSNAVNVTDVYATYKDCLKLAQEAWKEAGAGDGECLEMIAAGAHSMFIERCKRNLFGVTESVPF